MDSFRTKGFGLLEFVLTLSVLAFGFFAMLKMQWLAFYHNKDAELRTLAISTANNLAEDILSRSGQHLSSSTINQWKQRIAEQFPLGLGHLSEDGETVTIEVSWLTSDSVKQQCELIDDPNRECVKISIPS